MGGDIAFDVIGIVGGILLLVFAARIARWQVKDRWTWPRHSENTYMRMNQVIGVAWIGFGLLSIGGVI